MLAARVEPKNGPQENKKTGNFKPVALGQFQTGVDTPAEMREGCNESIRLPTEAEDLWVLIVNQMNEARAADRAFCPRPQNGRAGIVRAGLFNERERSSSLRLEPKAVPLLFMDFGRSEAGSLAGNDRLDPGAH